MELDYLEGTIREYDLQSANVSVLAEKGLISEDMYLDLREGGKSNRNRIVGNLIKAHGEVYDILKTEVAKYVETFIKVNKIDDSNVIEISHDAIFTIDVKESVNRKLKLSFGDHINFIPKNDYLSMLSFNATDTSSVFIKLYLSSKGNDIICRYGKLDEDNILYDHMVDLMRFIYNDNRTCFNKTLRSFILDSRKENSKPVCNTCTNERLIDAFRDLAML